MKIPRAITIDLQNGMGLEECLIKHGTNLKTLFSNVSSGYPKAKVSNEETRYIEKRGRNYYIKRKIINKTYYYGIYATLEDAQLVRDQLIVTGWKQNQVNNICEKVGVKRIPGKTEERYFEVTS
ncbi:hypothetical protein [uncultured Methanobrevibacter sp.]|uniref:hypothetical protein n=1 Tax=uncultured Methanobrevibacter sp. TaxID=253161 RepID=UPI0025DD6844|nr:hypothetical protein [uncultured Methanobrevibacter sp.]